MWNIIFLVTGAIFIALLMVIALSKKGIKSRETSIFKALILSNALGYVFEISLQLFVRKYGVDVAVVDIFSRFYLVIIFVWFTCFSSYASITCIDSKSNIRLLLNFLNMVSLFVGMFLIAILPFKKFYEAGKMYIYGGSVDVLKIFLGVYMFVWLVLMIKNHRNIKEKKYAPIYLVLFFLAVNVVLQSIDPSILISTVMGTFICYVMYFTIENPDVAMLEEFRIAKNRAEKANEEKEIFLYDITQNIRVPLNDIKKASSWLDSNAKDITTKDIRDGAYYINNKATSILDKVNNVLDITNMELTNIKVYQSKYDIENIINHIKKTYKEFDGVKLIYSIDSNIPKELYGDSLRLKQLISVLMDNATKYTEEGYIELKLNTIVKRDVCRLIISVEDTGCGIKASEIDNTFNKENQLYNNLDKIDDSKKNLAIAKSIANLLGGILLLDSEIGKGTKITLVLDQTIYKEKSSELNKLEEDTEKYIDKKKVMVVVEDEEYMAKVKKKLVKYDIIIEPIDKGAKCIEKIRLKHKYDLIIMDELLRDLSSLEILKRLKKVTNFKTPICLLTDDTENENFIDEGFSYLLDKKLSKRELDKLMREIV